MNSGEILAQILHTLGRLYEAGFKDDELEICISSYLYSGLAIENGFIVLPPDAKLFGVRTVMVPWWGKYEWVVGVRNPELAEGRTLDDERNP